MTSRSLSSSRLQRLLIPITAVVGALAVGAIMLLALGANPFEGYWAMLEGAFGSTNALIETALKATPLLLVGVGITIAFRANVINIGGEGQIIAGAIFSTGLILLLPDMSSFVLVPLVVLAGLAGGALWGAIPGALKAYFGVSEILSTIMLNLVAAQVMNFLLRGPFRDPNANELGAIPQTERLSEGADLPIIVGSRLHSGPLIAVIAAVLAYILLWRTTAGYRLRAVGLNPDASRYGGIPVKRSIVLALTFSGALAGLAGALLVFGNESHRFVTDGSAAGFTGSAGFNGIVTALFGALHPLWTIPSSFLFGGLLVGANSLQRAVQVPQALIVALNGLVVVFVVSSDWLRKRLGLVEEARQPEGENEVEAVE
ncbi:MAG: ABC transporter permease [Acidimicrobiia bacterium]|nr:ABC transporter permease [Acidimicrobiia bacterium]